MRGIIEKSNNKLDILLGLEGKSRISGFETNGLKINYKEIIIKYLLFDFEKFEKQSNKHINKFIK